MKRLDFIREVQSLTSDPQILAEAKKARLPRYGEPEEVAAAFVVSFDDFNPSRHEQSQWFKEQRMTTKRKTYHRGRITVKSFKRYNYGGVAINGTLLIGRYRYPVDVFMMRQKSDGRVHTTLTVLGRTSDEDATFGALSIPGGDGPETRIGAIKRANSVVRFLMPRLRILVGGQE